MNTHKNARLTSHGRALLLSRVHDEGVRPAEVAQAQGVSVRTVCKWLRRFRAEGSAGLGDRTSRPVRSPFATDAATVKQLIARRHQCQTYRQIAQALELGQSTVARLLKHEGLNRLAVPVGVVHQSAAVAEDGIELGGDRQGGDPGHSASVIGTP